MPRKLTSREAVSIAGKRKVKAGGRNGGRYPKDHVRDDPGCYCNGCMRRRKRETESMELARRLMKPQSMGPVRPASTAAPREDLDRNPDWGA